MSQASALAPSGKSRALFRASRRLEEGRFAIVTNVGSGMRWTQWCRCARVAPTNDAKAYGEVVRSWRPDAGAKLCGMIHKATGARKPGPRESTKHTVKTIAQGVPDDPAELVVTAACLFICRWAKASVLAQRAKADGVPTIRDEPTERRWARRKGAFAYPTEATAAKAYFAFPARLSRNTPCSPNMFQNHQGALSRSGRP
jgi:hypothetical protein